MGDNNDYVTNIYLALALVLGPWPRRIHGTYSMHSLTLKRNTGHIQSTETSLGKNCLNIYFLYM